MVLIISAVGEEVKLFVTTPLKSLVALGLHVANRLLQEASSDVFHKSDPS